MASLSELETKLKSTISSWLSQVANQKAETILLFSLALFAIAWYTWLAKKSSKGKFPLPPGPRGLPLLGYLPFLTSDLHHCFGKLSQTYGPIMKLRLGSKLCIVVSSPALAKEVMREQDPTFANRDVPVAALAMNYNGKDIGWAPNGPHLRLLRRVCSRDLMSNKSLDSVYHLRRQEVRQMVRDVHSSINGPVDLSELTFLTVLNVLTSTVWGGTLDGEGRRTIAAEFREWTQDAMALCAKPNISDLFPVLARFDIQRVVREMNKLAEWMDKVFDTIIGQRREMDSKEGEKKGNKEESKDFLKLLLELTEDGDRKTPFTVTDLKALLLDMMVAGTDTTSTMVAWAMGELLRHPQEMKKVQEELEQVVGMNNVVEEPDLPKLRYLDAVLKETHRLHPALPLLVSRSPSETCVVGGFTVPKGCQVMVNAWAIQRDPKVWSNPLEFKPERFLTEEYSKCEIRGTDYRYVPFGSGRRICVGLPLAERMLPFVVASLVHSFEWRWPEGTNYEFAEKFGIVTKQAVPLVAIPSPRLSNPELYA
ncbi:flavonoid 3'-monooxygenase CYP75B137-like [Tasmannia lanceolata]|uniref:flavonoid 3'-monooxygenase CYP75B137-like n=1 Tax=Tasmannia lanceolata TaxID=3420 RepID=UPI0040634863